MIPLTSLKLILFIVISISRGAFLAAWISLVRVRYLTPGSKSLLAFRKIKAIEAILDESRAHNKWLNAAILIHTLVAGFFAFRIVFPAGMDAAGAHPLAALLRAIAMGLLFYLIADRLPRVVGFRHPKATIRLMLAPLWVLKLISWPFDWLMRRIFPNSLLTLRNENVDYLLFDITAQIHGLGADRALFSPELINILNNMVSMQDLEVSDILIPRNKLRYMDLENSFEESVQLAKQSGHTRFPLCRGDLDRCVGIIHIKDLFRKEIQSKEALRAAQRQVITIGEGEKLERALQLMLQCHSHMLLVTDRFGGTMGAITLEDVLEQLVGTIQDEFDEEEASMIRKLSDDSFYILGSTPIHDVEKNLQVSIQNEDVSTLSGLITSALGRIPDRGETLTLGNLSILVEKTTKTRIVSCRVTLIQDDSEPDEA